MTRLSVNVNKVALLRNSRPLDIPNVVRAAELAIDAGAHGITVHPRPDARHIRPDDVHSLHKLVRARGVEFNIEGNPFQPMPMLARMLRARRTALQRRYVRTTGLIFMAAAAWSVAGRSGAR